MSNTKQIKTCLNYATVQSVSSRHYHLQMSSSGTQSIIKWNGNNYGMVIVNCRCHTELALFGSALEVMLSGPIQNATCPHRALFFHFTTTNMPIYANPVLMKQCCKCKKSKTQGGQDAASKLRHRPLGSAICQNYLLACKAFQKDL